MTLTYGKAKSVFSNSKLGWSAAAKSKPVYWSSIRAPMSGTALATFVTSSVLATSLVAASSAQEIWPDSYVPAIKSVSLMMPPRAQLMMRTPSFIWLIVSLLIRFAVSLVLGVWTVMKSDRR